MKFQFPATTKIVERNQISLMSGVMEIGSDVNTGTYGFRIYVCAEDNIGNKCQGLSESYGQYDFIIEVV